MTKGVHPNSLKALEATKYKKGKVPTGGRPKGALSLKERLNKYLEMEMKTKMPDGTITDKQVLDNVILSLLAKAIKGDVRAIEVVLERQFGKEADKVELTGRDGQPIEIEHSRRLQEVYGRAAEAFDTGPGISSTGLTKN